MGVQRGLISVGSTIFFGLLSWILCAVAISSSQVWWQIQSKTSSPSSTSESTTHYMLTEYQDCTASSCSTHAYDWSGAGFYNKNEVIDFMSRTKDLANVSFAILVLAFVCQLLVLVLLLMKRFRASFLMVIPMMLLSILGFVIVMASAFRFRNEFVPNCLCGGIVNPSVLKNRFKLCSDSIFEGSESVTLYGSTITLTYGAQSGWHSELVAFLFCCGLLVSGFVAFFRVRLAYKDAQAFSAYQPQTDTPQAAYYAYTPDADATQQSKPSAYVPPQQSVSSNPTTTNSASRTSAQPLGQPNYANYAYAPTQQPQGNTRPAVYTNI